MQHAHWQEPHGPVGGSGPGQGERWQHMWSHREHLLKVARRRSMSVEDAEDAVHEAMLRAVENPHVDDERLGAWLTTVTMRLCVDRYRQVNREVEVRSRSTLAAPSPVPVEEAVCDRAEAKWLADRSGELPARQAEALRLKSEDLDVGQVACAMGLSYQAVESLLARARRTLRNSLAGTLGVAVWLCGRCRPRPGGGAQAAALVSTAATAAVLGFALPYAHEWDRSGPPPSATSETAGPPASDPGRGGAPAPAGSTADHRSGRLGAASTAEPSTGGAPLLPPLPPLPSLRVPSAPSVGSVPVAVPSLPPAPSVPSVPSVPSARSVPSVPAVPPHQAPAVPLTGGVPDGLGDTPADLRVASAPSP